MKEELYRKLNEGILDERLAEFRRNLAKNGPLIRQSGGIAGVIGEFRDRHVVVAGAGPSLERDIPALRAYQHRREIVIIATDMALLPLVKSGVRPRFAMSCETVPVDFFSAADTSGMTLIAFSCVSNVNLRRWKGAMSFYNWMIREEPYESLWREAGMDLGFVATGNTVTTQAVALALGCGIRSLLLCGNDLAFRRQYYARGVAAHGSGMARCGRINTAETGEWERMRSARHYELKRDGKTYFTSHQFLAAKMWLEELFAAHPVAVYESGEPGCSDRVVRRADAAGYFRQFDTRRAKRRKP